MSVDLESQSVLNNLPYSANVQDVCTPRRVSRIAADVMGVISEQITQEQLDRAATVQVSATCEPTPLARVACRFVGVCEATVRERVEDESGFPVISRASTFETRYGSSQ